MLILPIISLLLVATGIYLMVSSEKMKSWIRSVNDYRIYKMRMMASFICNIVGAVGCLLSLTNGMY
jgi:hypothetical protein